MKRLRHPLLVSAALVLLVFGSILALQRAGKFQAGELEIYDYLLAHRPPVQAEDPRIVIVTQTEASTEKYDFPLSDKRLSDLLEKIEVQNPRAIGVDLYRDVPVPRDHSGEATLNKTLDDHPNIIWVFLSTQSGQPGVKPPAHLKESLDRIGYNDWAFDENATVRRGGVFLSDPQGNTFQSFAVLLTNLYLAGETPPITFSMKDDVVLLGDRPIRRFLSNDGGYVGADNGGYQFLLDFAGPRAFTTIPLIEVLEGRTPPDFFRDRIVLIGSTDESTNDFFRTPLKLRESGVLIHAHSINQLLRLAVGRDLTPVTPPFTWGILGCFCLLGGLLAYTIRSPWLLVPFLTGIACVLWLINGRCFAHSIWLPLIPPMSGLLVSAGLVTAYMAWLEHSHRHALMNIFQRNVSRRIADDLWDRREEFSKGGRPVAQKITATVLFTDLKGFTTISEKLDPPQLFETLSHYTGLMARQVESHGGVVLTFTGDGLMAVFGAPVPSRTEEEINRHAIGAVRCALGMDRVLELFNAERAARGEAPMAMRVGILTGPVVAGSAGDADRLEYTILGDTVNTASRLESFDKEKGFEPPTNCRILVGEPTLQRIGSGFDSLFIDTISLKGKAEKTTIYRILRETSPVSSL